MFRAAFAFNSREKGVLPCVVGDQFTILDSKDEQWWLVQNGKGQVGYVPASYLAPDDVAHGEIMKSIDRAIQKVEEQISRADGSSMKELQNNLKKLQIHRQKVASEQQKATKRRAPPAPTSPTLSSSSALSSHPAAETAASKSTRSPSEKATAPSPPVITSNCTSSSDRERPTTSEDNADSVPLSTPDTAAENSCTEYDSEQQKAEKVKTDVTSLNLQPPAGLGAVMVEHIRRKTGLSHDKSQVAVVTILNLLAERVPATDHLVCAILDTVQHQHTGGASLEESSDAVRLCHLFHELESVKDDSQQRSWFLHEDEDTICQHIKELIAILEGANPSTSREVMLSDNYTACHNLVLYYQMETRLTIRLLLLQAFGAMCSLEVRVVTELLNSVLPLELARDIQNDASDIQKLTYSALVLAMVFSTGEAVPLQYYEHINVKFVEFLLDNIESPPANDEAEAVPDVFVKLLLAFNLHFELPSDNLVMAAIADRGTAKTFTEKLMLLFNREDDPVRMFEYHNRSPNSVVKFFSDLYSCLHTANLLYTNDAKVLIDIIVRQLNDLSPGDQTRTDYLSLTQLILANSDYAEHRHRQSELQACFTRIALEDRDGVDMDRRIVEQIWTQFPQHFHSAW